MNEKSRDVCIKARSPPASLAFKGQVTEHTTVKWPTWEGVGASESDFQAGTSYLQLVQRETPQSSIPYTPKYIIGKLRNPLESDLFDRRSLCNWPKQIQEGVIWQMILGMSKRICWWPLVPKGQKCWGGRVVSYNLDITTKINSFEHRSARRKGNLNLLELILISHTSHPNLQSHTTTGDHCSLYREGQQALALCRKC